MTGHGFRFNIMRLDSDVFNELGFSDCDGHAISMLEARTFHASEDAENDSHCGSWFELTLPVRDALRAAQLWAPMRSNPERKSATVLMAVSSRGKRGWSGGGQIAAEARTIDRRRQPSCSRGFTSSPADAITL